METIVHIVLFILFIEVCFCAGWSFSSCISINKKLKELNNTQLELIKLLEEENKHCKDIINHCKTVIDDDKIILSNSNKTIDFIKMYLIFIKQNMVRRKTPIIDKQ